MRSIHYPYYILIRGAPYVMEAEKVHLEKLIHETYQDCRQQRDTLCDGP